MAKAKAINMGRVFRSAKEIMEHYQISRPAFDMYRRMGMPMRLINGSYHAHEFNINQWFQQITAVASREEEAEGNERLE